MATELSEQTVQFTVEEAIALRLSAFTLTEAEYDATVVAIGPLACAAIAKSRGADGLRGALDDLRGKQHADVTASQRRSA